MPSGRRLRTDVDFRTGDLLRRPADAGGANAFVQYNSTMGRRDLNLRLRYAVTEETDLWVVVNEGLDWPGPAPLQPLEPRSLSRALTVKYSHVFGF